MAKKKSAAKQSRPKASTLDGLRRATAVRKQIARWQERKWPLAPNAAEWLRFALALRAEAAIIEAEALAHVNPSLLAKSKKDLLRERVAVTSEGADDEPA